MSAIVNRIRIEASGDSRGEVGEALDKGAMFVAQSWGGTWYEDEDEHPRQIQSAAKGFWGYAWLKRVVMT